jgi:hypothetical protein
VDALDGGIELLKCSVEGSWKQVAVGGEGQRVRAEI